MKISLARWACLLCVIVSSCSEPALVGLDEEFSSEKPGFFNDSLSIQASTLNDDSVITYQYASFLNRTICLLGSYKDPVFGDTYSDIITQLQLNPDVVNLTGQAITLDSLVLRMEYNKIFGDTTTTQSLSIYYLNEDLKQDTTYYSKKKISYDQVTGVTVTYKVRAGDSSTVDGKKVAPTLSLRLDQNGNSFATEFKNKIQSQTFTTSAELLKVIKGLYIKAGPAASNSAISYFNIISNNTKMSMYYTVGTDKKRIDFPITSSAVKLNSFRHEYNGTLAQTSDTSQYVFIQGLAGKRVRIQVPGLKSAFAKNTVSINKAELVVTAADLTGDITKYPPPQYLYLFAADSLIHSKFTLDYLEPLNYLNGVYNTSTKQYKFNLARNIQYVIDHPEEKDYGLILTMHNSSSNSANRVVLKAGNNLMGRMKLNITYTKIQ